MTPNDLVGATVPFRARRALLGEALWVRDNFCSQADTHILRTFSDQFSFLIPDAECFSEIEFGSDEQILQAERYGGNGIGENGGGVRCGNLGGFQLKGIGCNPLVGSHDNRWYAYGGLNARDAIYEAIMAQILDQLLPIGVAKVFGIIPTSATAAYYETGVKTWGAVLVREACMRPGHLLRARNYKPNPPDGVRIPRDSARVRAVNQAFAKQFPDVRDLVRWLARFLHNAARQFAFARLARVLHGGISPSNLSFDGRWIDLTNASFIGGGVNIGGVPSFYEEPFAIPEILTEVASTVGKYNAINLNVAPLVDYYKVQLEEWTSRHLSYFFGLPSGLSDTFIKGSGFGTLVRQVSGVLNSGKIVVNSWPREVAADDPIVTLQGALFQSFDNPQRSADRLSRLKWLASGFDAQAVIAAFQSAMLCAFECNLNPHKDFNSFIMVCAIEALRPSRLREYFFKGRLMERIQTVLEHSPMQCRSLIDDSLGVGNWMFMPRKAGAAAVFRSASFSMNYCPASKAFHIATGEGSLRQAMTTPRSGLELVGRLPYGSLDTQGHDFRKGLLDLLSMLPDTAARAAAFAR